MKKSTKSTKSAAPKVQSAVAEVVALPNPLDAILADRSQRRRETKSELTPEQIERMIEQEPSESQGKFAKQLGLTDDEIATMNRYEVSEWIDHALASPINRVVVERLVKWGCDPDLVATLTGEQSLELWKRLTAGRRKK